MNSPEKFQRLLPWLVWTLRIIIGSTFIVSGFAKADDPWGFIFKIEEYLRLWGLTQPRSLVLMAATVISGAEFVLGAMVVMGCYKRTAVWLLLAMMAVMLPLTAYIFVSDPVSDCGCFGDFLRLSNGATFFKNLLITAGLVFLAIYNRKVAGLFGSYVQWLTVVITATYIAIVSFVGYNAQPMIDFRSFPIGRQLLNEDVVDEDDSMITFVYEKGGEKREFAMDELPDSSWTFVERHESRAGKSGELTDFVVSDGDMDVTADVVAPEGEEIIAVIPEYDRADVSYTYLLNELENYMNSRGGSMVGIIAGNSEEAEQWVDLSMADYPVYAAEGTMLKEMVRGTMALVGLRDGKILWKRTAGSIDTDLFEAPENYPEFDELIFDGRRMARNMTLILLSVLAVLFLLDRSGRLLRWNRQLKKLRRSISLTEKND